MADKSKAALTWTELRVGVLAIVSLAVLAFAILYIGGGGGSPFAPKYLVRALMTDVNGLKPGAPVRLGGVEVGTVTRVGFAPEGGAGMVEVVMRIDRRVKPRITTESKAALGSLGLLGEKAVDITSAAHGPAIEDGGYLSAATEDPFRGLLTDASGSTTHLRKILSRMDAGEGLIGKALRDEELYDRMVDVSERMQKAMGKLESERGPLGRMMNDAEMSRQLASSVKGIDDVVARVEAGKGPLGALSKDEQLVRDLKSASTNLSDVLQKLERGEGTAGRLLNDDALFNKLDSLTNRFDALVSKLERGEGSAGRLVQDPEFYNNLNGAAKDLRGLIDDIRKDPGKYLRVKLSVF
jgi:phospholipid/cholesterol/gamma-HCH transport system substrate-binding protein